jgi:hypothetical protein
MLQNRAYRFADALGIDDFQALKKSPSILRAIQRSLKIIIFECSLELY